MSSRGSTPTSRSGTSRSRQTSFNVRSSFFDRTPFQHTKRKHSLSRRIGEQHVKSDEATRRMAQLRRDVPSEWNHAWNDDLDWCICSGDRILAHPRRCVCVRSGHWNTGDANRRRTGPDTGDILHIPIADALRHNGKIPRPPTCRIGGWNSFLVHTRVNRNGRNPPMARIRLLTTPNEVWR